MKRALTILALAAAPLLADEPAKTSTKTSTATSTAAEPARPRVISADPVAPTDSPLVAAARRTNRAKKSTHRITNANLGKYGSTGARITTSSVPAPLVMPAPLPETAPPAELKATAARAAERSAALAEAQKKAKEDAEKKMKAALAAERAEEGMYGETDADSGYGDGSGSEPTDPATQEKKPPQG